MKINALLIMLMLQINISFGQGAFSNTTNSTLQKVLEAYPRSFDNLQGDQFNSSSDIVNYHSKVSIPGSRYAYISKSRKTNEQTYSWNCILFESASFQSARNKYKDYFTEITNAIVTVDGQKRYILTGAYKQPTGDQPTQSIFFNLLPSTGDYSTVKVELTVRQEKTGWVVSLLVYNQQDIGLQAYRSNGF